jgi:hypothetical protein
MATLSSIITPTNVLTATSTATLTNKTISGSSNTVTNIPLSTGVTGTLPVANGGTGLTTLGTAAQILAVNSGATALEYVALPAGSAVVRVARTSNTILDGTNRGNLIDITSGTFTQTFTAAATLGSGWFVYLRNSGTGVITLDPNASELIDGLTTYLMYGGETRLIQCSGTEFTSVVLSSFYHTFTASGSFTKPPGYSAFQGLLWSGGGSGGKSASNVGGGSGGGASFFTLPASSIGTTETVTIGAGGASQTFCSGCGNNGGVSSFAVITSSSGRGGVRSTNSFVAGGAGYFSNIHQEITCNSLGQVAFIGSRASSSVGNFGSGFYGGASAATARVASGSVYGGGGGGGVYGCCGTNYVLCASASIFGGSGGASSLTTNATAGVSPAGGGGASINGLGNSGAGGRGELRIWGIA